MDTFILYSEYLEQIQDLDLLQRGRLLTAILEYANGTNLEDIKANCDAAAFVAFKFIKARMDRDQKAYQEKCDRNRENVRKRWARRKNDTSVYDRKDRIESKEVDPVNERDDTTVYDRIPSDTNEYDSIHNDNYNDNDLKKSGDKSPRKESTTDSVEEPPTKLIIEYLNAKTGKHFRTDTELVTKLIAERWREGYRLEDFQRVIDSKVRDWSGTKYAKFLKPTTLFADRFDEYCNQSETGQDPAGRESGSRRTQMTNYTQRETDYDGLLAAGVIGG